MYQSLQACRALAALMVVCFHVCGDLHQDKYLGHAADSIERLMSFGDAGVPFFFVLSGFIITRVHLRDFNRPERLWDYAFKRAARIYPSYWIVFTLAYAAAWTSPTLRNTLPQDALTLIKSALLLPQDPALTGGTGAPVLFVAWTLQYEMMFYLTMGLAIIHQRLLWLPIGLFLLNQLGHVFGEGYLQTFFANQRIYLFGMGVLLALFSHHRLHLPMAYARGIAITGTIAFVALASLEIYNGATSDRSDHVLIFGVISTVLVLGLIRMEDAGWRLAPEHLLVRLGNASYVLYLIHVPVMSVLVKAATMLSNHVGQFGLLGASLSALISVMTCCVLALAFHSQIERPLLKRLSNRPVALAA
jgi:exopolysaccharide production protein ExoZ